MLKNQEVAPESEYIQDKGKALSSTCIICRSFEGEDFKGCKKIMDPDLKGLNSKALCLET